MLVRSSILMHFYHFLDVRNVVSIVILLIFSTAENFIKVLIFYEDLNYEEIGEEPLYSVRSFHMLRYFE